MILLWQRSTRKTRTASPRMVLPLLRVSKPASLDRLQSCGNAKHEFWG